MSKISPIRAIGPTIPLRYMQDQQLPDDKDFSLHFYVPNVSACMNWVNARQDKSVVYVSFGSLAELDVAQMEEVAWGLKQSDKYFLWVVRPSEEPKLPKDFVQETFKKGLVVKWCSQLDVLAHKAIACFVTHCGWNSTLEALSSGVPMVAMPRWSDQSVNAKYVVDVWKMGVKAAQNDETGIVTRDVVEYCIREVMDGKRGEELKRNAKKWREIARKAVKEGGSSDRCINEFVDNLVQHKQQTYEISVSSCTRHEKTNVVSSVNCSV